MQTLTQGYKNSVMDSSKQKHLSKAQKAITRWAQVDDHQALLDLSCHDTRLLSYYAQRYNIRTCGLCDSLEGLINTHGLSSAEIMQGSVHDIPWRDESFHSVFISAPIDEARYTKLALEEIKRVLRPDGQLLIALPIFPLEMFPLASENDCLLKFSKRKELLAYLKELGFEDTSLRFSGFGYVTMVARQYKA